MSGSPPRSPGKKFSPVLPPKPLPPLITGSSPDLRGSSPRSPLPHVHVVGELVDCVIGSNIDDEGYDRIPKSQVLVCGHGICSVDLASIRKPWCPLCRTPLAGPLVTPSVVSDAIAREIADVNEEKNRAYFLAELASAFAARGQTLDVNDLYDKTADELAAMLPTRATRVGPAPAPPSPHTQQLMAGGGGSPLSPSVLAAIFASMEGKSASPVRRVPWAPPPPAVVEAPWGGEYKAPRAPSPGLSPNALAMIAAINAATEGGTPEPSTLQRDIAEAIAMSQGASGTPGLSPNTLAAIAAINAAHAPSELPLPGVAGSPRHGTLPLPGSPRRAAPQLTPPRALPLPGSPRHNLPLPGSPRRAAPLPASVGTLPVPGSPPRGGSVLPPRSPPPSRGTTALPVPSSPGRGSVLPPRSPGRVAPVNPAYAALLESAQYRR